MAILRSLAAFMVLFLGLCMFVVEVIAIINIITKSYQPRRTLPIIATLIVLFILSGGLALSKVLELFQPAAVEETTSIESEF